MPPHGARQAATARPVAREHRIARSQGRRDPGRACEVRIGTSGWHYKHWLADFYPARYPADKMFSWYAREFRTVEINKSFYRLPEKMTFARWKELAPPGFVFAVKASRFITHMKRLKDVEDPLEVFFARLEPLGSSHGPVLFSCLRNGR